MFVLSLSGRSGCTVIHSHAADHSQRSCDGERSSPAESLRHPGRERRGHRAPNLRPHVDHAGENTRTAAGDVRRHRPERALRDIQRARTAGKNHAGKLRALHARAKHQKNSGKKERDRSQTATPYAEPVGAGKAVTEDAAAQTADRSSTRKGSMENSALALRLKPRTCAM